jgi:hypothetical protein
VVLPSTFEGRVAMETDALVREIQARQADLHTADLDALEDDSSSQCARGSAE